MDVPTSWEAGDLWATRIAPADLDDLIDLHRDPLVMGHLGGVRDVDATLSYLQTNMDHWSEHGFGLYALRRPDGTWVGRAGLRLVRPLGQPEVEVAYALAARWWGRNWAVAVTGQLCNIAADAALADGVVAFTETTNRRSWRVMQKAGFAFDCQFLYAGTPHVLYRRPLATREQRR